MDREQGVKIEYGDFAPNAKESFLGSGNAEYFVDWTELQRPDLKFPNMTNPVEDFQLLLDGNAIALDTEQPTGFWSNVLSQADGSFPLNLTVSFSASQKFSSSGITLHFDEENGIHPTFALVYWMDGNSYLSVQGFNIDSAKFFFENSVQNFTRVQFEFRGMNMPNSRLRIRGIDFGYGSYFFGDELQNVKILQEMDELSQEISINTTDFTLISNRDYELTFQENQSVRTYFDGELKSKTFIKSARRKSRNAWEVQSDDYIGMLADTQFRGGLYENKNAEELLTEIFAEADVPFEILDASLRSKTVMGYIPYTDCREALRQVAFAIGAVVDTTSSEVVKIGVLDDAIKQTLPLDRIMQGQSLGEELVYSNIELVYHEFEKNTREDTFETLYETEKSGAGENIFLVFDEPKWYYDIMNGEILETGANYVIFNVNEGGMLRGHSVLHRQYSKAKQNLTAVKSNSLTIDDMTLVSAQNVADLLENCYNKLVKSTETNMRIVEGKHESDDGYVYDEKVNLGDVLAYETEFTGTMENRLVSQSYNLNGGIIVKEAILK